MAKQRAGANWDGGVAFGAMALKRPSPMRQQVYESLRDQILLGRIPAYTRLVEARLAEQLGVSRTPIREALHLLEREGLVESAPRSGYLVRGIDWEEIQEICEIRIVNETLAARWAISRMTEESLAALEHNVALSEAAIRARRWDEFIEKDGEFHELLVRASGSRRLLELCQTLRRHMLVYRTGSLAAPRNAALALEGHQRILRFLKEKDEDGVAGAIRRHLEEAREGIRRAVFARERM